MTDLLMTDDNAYVLYSHALGSDKAMLDAQGRLPGNVNTRANLRQSQDIVSIDHIAVR